MKIICIGRNYADHAKELNDGAEIPKEWGEQCGEGRDNAFEEQECVFLLF